MSTRLPRVAGRAGQAHARSLRDHRRATPTASTCIDAEMVRLDLADRHRGWSDRRRLEPVEVRRPTTRRPPRRRAARAEPGPPGAARGRPAGGITGDQADPGRRRAWAAGRPTPPPCCAGRGWTGRWPMRARPARAPTCRSAWSAGRARVTRHRRDRRPAARSSRATLTLLHAALRLLDAGGLPALGRARRCRPATAPTTSSRPRWRSSPGWPSGATGWATPPGWSPASPAAGRPGSWRAPSPATTGWWCAPGARRPSVSGGLRRARR